jgi:hypothetical protein
VLHLACVHKAAIFCLLFLKSTVLNHNKCTSYGVFKKRENPLTKHFLSFHLIEYRNAIHYSTKNINFLKL